MKRLIGLVFAVVMLFTFTACTSDVPKNVKDAMNQPDSQNTSKSSSTDNKVLYVQSRENAGDSIAIKRLKETHGLEVTVITDKELTIEKAQEGFALIFVGESVNSGKIRNIFVKLPVPVIYAEPQSLGDTGMTLTEAFGKLDAGNVAKTITIKDSKHPLAAGLQNDVDVYKEKGKMGYGEPGAEAIVVATVPNTDNQATIFAYDKGVKNAKGDPVVAREVYFYLFNGEEINQTENGWKLFDASVRWAMGK
ncbi:hypothetical protein [Paenibacillus sp. y28]|uniref:hypothetical protein n=1 Tax=Paenibacillus sp. y28 TaxID=3129110 RepID=UPI0030167F1D